MDASITPAQADAAVDLRARFPNVPARDVLDVVLEGCHGARLDRGAAWLHPRSPFGQIVAEAIDRGMTPDEWLHWSAPPADPELTTAVLNVWNELVLVQFAERYKLVI